MELRRSESRVPSSLFDMTMAGVREYLRKMWADTVSSPELKVVTASSYEVRREIERQDNKTKSEMMAMPYLAVIPAVVEQTNVGYNPFAARRLLGLSAGNDVEGVYNLNFKVTPVDIGAGISFFTENIDEALHWANLLSSRTGIGSFAVNVGETGALVRIKLKFDPQTSIPEAEFSSVPELIKVDSTLIISSYMGNLEYNSIVKKLTVNIGGDAEEQWNFAVGKGNQSD